MMAGVQFTPVSTSAVASDADPELTEPARAFLRASQEDDGSWRGHWWDDDEYTVARAAEALAMADGAGDRERVRLAASWAASRIGPDGAVWSEAHAGPSAFATALAAQTMALVDEPRIHEALCRSLDYLIAVQLADGSWPASARLRVPPPDAVDPLARPEDTLVYLDRHRTFTTGTVLGP